MNCTKKRLAAGLRPDPLGIALSQPPLAVIRGGKGGKGKERVENRMRD